MKFTDGYWLKRKGWDVRHPRHLSYIHVKANQLVTVAPTKFVQERGQELDVPHITTEYQAVADGVIRVKIEHHQGYLPPSPQFELFYPDNYQGQAECNPEELTGTLQAGTLKVQIGSGTDIFANFYVDEKPVTRSILRSVGLAISPENRKYLHEQLVIQPGESVFGLGERFGPVVKNGQVVDMWNADGGTASEKAYKNVPFYLTDRGYGVFVNHPEKVSFEVGSETNSRVQFSVPGNYLEYFVIAGPTPKQILSRYTKLTGRAPKIPAWSYGLWLSTSFKTDYSEETVNYLVDEMERRKLPLSVLHFDCYWMRQNHWCDFTWDPKMFPDPAGMLSRYHRRGLKICVWINPYIAQQSDVFQEAKEQGFLLKNPRGEIKQWDHWQAGMGWVDFTNPRACEWYKNKLKELIAQGVDCFKTDFGERIPTEDVAWFDKSDPFKMRNYYSFLYNQTVIAALEESLGKEQALVFARSATAGGQRFPTHWGGDSEPTFESMGETLRGGLSLSMSGFGYWSHDMGGFEGKPNPEVFIRWFPFGMLSTHSRLHGSDSFRAPWIYGDEAVKTAQRFTALKNRLMPYLIGAAEEVSREGTPVLRHSLLQYPEDRGAATVDTQYFFGPSLLVAPVFNATGEASFYLPNEGWTNLLDGHRIERRGWQQETHDLQSLPLMVPDGTVLPIGACADRPDYRWDQGVCLYLFGAAKQLGGTYQVPKPDGTVRVFKIQVQAEEMTVSCESGETDWSVCLVNASSDLEVLDGEVVDRDFCEEITAGKRVAPQKSTLIRLNIPSE